MNKITHVEEDVMDTMFLGANGKSELVKINTLLVWASLNQVLTELMDVSTQDYSNMKGLDPHFY